MTNKPLYRICVKIDYRFKHTCNDDNEIGRRKQQKTSLSCKFHVYITMLADHRYPVRLCAVFSWRVYETTQVTTKCLARKTAAVVLCAGAAVCSITDWITTVQPNADEHRVLWSFVGRDAAWFNCAPVAGPAAARLCNENDRVLVGRPGRHLSVSVPVSPSPHSLCVTMFCSSSSRV